MTKYHVNEKGEPGVCNAREGNCPFASDENHFSTKDDARKFYEDFQSRGTRYISMNRGTVKAFHGSLHKFDEFDYSKMGRNGAELGWGFYFADTEDAVSAYAAEGYVYEVDFHPRNPMLLGEKRIPRKDIEEILLMAEDENGFLTDNWGDVEYEGREKVLKRAVAAYDTGDDINNITQLINDTEMGKEIYTYLYEKYGIDSIESDPHRMWKTSQVYVATHPSALTIRTIRAHSVSESGEE